MLFMSKQIPEEVKPLTPEKKALLALLAFTYLILIVLWIANNLNKPLFGIGSIEGFNRTPAPVAATAPMTWRFAPGLGHLAVLNVLSSPLSFSQIERLNSISGGPTGTNIYRISYRSDSKTVYGLMGIPAKTPAPVIVLCHPSDTPYQTGLHTEDTVKFLAGLGVVAFAPDYQGWGNSEGARGDEVRDVLNALAALRRDPAVAKGKEGLIGYSMGGGIAARAAAIDTNINLLVLYYAQMLGSVEELQDGLRYGKFESISEIKNFIDEGKKNGADAAELEYTLRMISPIYHLYDFSGRAVIFHGEKDNVVSIRQSQGLESELRRLGKNVELVTYPALSHAFANSIENPSKEKLAEVVKAALLK